MHRKRPEDLSATWHERSHAIMLQWACCKGMWLDSRQTRHRLDSLCSCSNLASHGGIRMDRAQIWQQRRPQANHVKVRTACWVAPPPSTSPSFKLSVAPMVDSLAWLFITPLKNTSQSRARWDGTECVRQRKFKFKWTIILILCLKCKQPTVGITRQIPSLTTSKLNQIVMLCHIP